MSPSTKPAALGVFPWVQNRMTYPLNSLSSVNCPWNASAILGSSSLIGLPIFEVIFKCITIQTTCIQEPTSFTNPYVSLPLWNLFLVYLLPANWPLNVRVSCPPWFSCLLLRVLLGWSQPCSWLWPSISYKIQSCEDGQVVFFFLVMYDTPPPGQCLNYTSTSPALTTGISRSDSHLLRSASLPSAVNLFLLVSLFQLLVPPPMPSCKPETQD